MLIRLFSTLASWRSGCCFFSWLVAGFIGLTPLQLAADVQQPTLAGSAQPPKQESQAPTPQGGAVIQRALETYRNLKTYQDTLIYSFSLRGAMAGQAVSEDESHQPRLAFAQSTHVSLTNIPVELITNGSRLWLISRDSREYIERDIASGERWQDQSGEYADIARAHPVLEILAGACRSRTGFPGLDELTGASLGNVNGEEAVMVQGFGLPATGVDLSNSQTTPAGARLFTKAWFSKRTGLLLKMQVDLKSLIEKNYADAPENVKLSVRSALIEMTFVDQQIDEPLQSAAFAFTPTGSNDGMKCVERFDIPGDDPESLNPQELIGRKAPGFRGALLGGGEATLAELSGKNALLIFWSVSCEPCLEMLRSLNKLSDEFQGNGVVIVGVNQDESARFERVQRVVNTEKIRFRQMLDPGGTTGRDFRAARIPLCVVIDPEGVIRAVFDGTHGDVSSSLAQIRAKLRELAPSTPAQP